MDSERRYQVVVSWSDADKAFLAVAPQLEGCIAHGSTRAEALENCELTISEWLVSAKELGWTIPVPLSTRERAKAEQKREAAEQKAFFDAVQKSAMAIVEKVLIPDMEKQVQMQKRMQKTLKTVFAPAQDFAGTLSRRSESTPWKRQTELAGR